MSAAFGHACLVLLVLSCAVVAAQGQRAGGGTGSRVGGRQPICAAPACTYTVDIGLADCNGRQLTCLPLSFNRALTMDMGQNSIHRLPPGMLTGYLRLRSLDLSNNAVAVIDDHAFSALPTLCSLTLSFNRITRLGAATFSGLRSIQTLHLQGNMITAIHGRTFDGLATMQDLNLAGNRLVALSDAVFKPLLNLHRLMLQENQLSASNDFLAGLKSLVELDLDGNRFLSLPDLSGMRMLGDLEITDSNIRRIKNDSFAGCSRIKELVLASNSIDTVEAGGFGGLHDLTDLHLSFNALQSLPEAVFKHLEFLERLYLQNNLLKSLRPAHFATLVRLKVLSLSNNQLTVFPPLPVSRSLSSLDLTFNSLTTFPKDALVSFPLLNRLLLLPNPLQCDCRLRHLRQWFINSGRRHRSNEIPHCESPTPLSRRRLTAAPPASMICTPPSVWARTATVTGWEGTNITLDCSGTGGFPSPTITWRSPASSSLLPDVPSGRYLVSDDGPMVIFRATPADSGIFTCVGSNPAGESTAPVALHVHKNPKLPATTVAAVAPVRPVTPAERPFNQDPFTPYVDLVTPPTTTGGDLAPEPPTTGWDESPRIPGEVPRDSGEDPYWNESPCGTHPTRVAAGIFLTFLLTCILCTIFYWSWYHGLLPRIAGRPMNLHSLKARQLSRNVAPMRSRANTAYNQMRGEGIYLRPSSYSGSEHSYSTSSSFEQDNRYVITDSIVDPDSHGRRQQQRHPKKGGSPKLPCLPPDSRHTYINADVVTNDSNYTALCTSTEQKRPSPQDTADHDGRPTQQAPSTTERSVDSRIYMDLS